MIPFSPHAATERAARRLRATNPYMLDAGIAGLVLLALAIPFVLPPADEASSPTLLGFVLALATAVPLIWRRRTPFLVAVLVTLPTVASVLYHHPGQPVPYALLVAIYTVFAMASAWQRVVTLGAWLVGISITELVRDESATSAAFTLMTFLSACVTGALARTRQAYVATLRDRAARLELEREIEATRAAGRERARIARDMHDILAHAVSLMVVQAEAGPVVVRADPERAVTAFESIAKTGRDAMDQLQRVLTTLKRGDAAVRAPSPSLEDLPALTQDVQRAGLSVRLEVIGESRPVPADIGLATYRVAQEALTNTVKHSRARQAVVRLEWTADSLRLTVTDDGRGASSSNGRGHGLIGIRERVTACGGTADAGPRLGGHGFEVQAAFPLAAAHRSALE